MTSADVARGGRAVERAPAVGRVHLAEVRRQRLHQRRRRARCSAIGDAVVKLHGGQAGAASSDVARVEDGGAPETQAVSVNGQDAVYLNVLRVPGGNTIEIVDAVKTAVARPEGPAARRRGQADLRSVDLRAHHATTGSSKEIVQALVLIALVILLFLQSVRGTLIVVGRHPALVRDHAHRPLRRRARRSTPSRSAG